MSNVTISDIGHAVITIDMELDRLCTEQAELEMKLEHCKARQVILSRAVDSILHKGLYEVNCAGD